MTEDGKESKLATMTSALATGGMVQVVFDASAAGVDVPLKFRGNQMLVLEYGINAPTAIPDLSVGENAIVATLRFGTDFYKCTVPWDAVYMIRNKDGDGGAWVFRRSIPPMLAAEVTRTKIAREHPKAKQMDDTPQARAQRLGLTVLSGGKGG
jgi:stringent starvation protein B